MLHALLHLHQVYVMSSSFPISTLLQLTKTTKRDKEVELRAGCLSRLGWWILSIQNCLHHLPDPVKSENVALCVQKLRISSL